MKESFPERFIDGSEETGFGNELDEGLLSALRSAVGNCEYSQKTVLSAMIGPHLEVVHEEEMIFKIDGEELELEKWSDRYD